jgi:hypothetical protein
MSFIQTANSGNPGAGNAFASRAATFASAQTQHNLNAIVISFGNPTTTTTNIITSVTDTAGNTYVPSNAFAFCVSGTQSAGQIIYHCPDIVSAAAGNVVTVNLSASQNFFTIVILEEAGLANSSAVDVTAGATANSGGTASANSGSLTTTVANDMLLGAFTMFDGPSGTPALTAGFTQRANYYTQLTADRFSVATGSYSVAATAGGTSGWVAQLVAFKPSSGAPPSIPPQIMVAN